MSAVSNQKVVLMIVQTPKDVQVPLPERYRGGRAGLAVHRRQSWGLGSRPPDFGLGVVGVAGRSLGLVG